MSSHSVRQRIRMLCSVDSWYRQRQLRSVAQLYSSVRLCFAHERLYDSPTLLQPNHRMWCQLTSNRKRSLIGMSHVVVEPEPEWLHGMRWLLIAFINWSWSEEAVVGNAMHMRNQWLRIMTAWSSQRRHIITLYCTIMVYTVVIYVRVLPTIWIKALKLVSSSSNRNQAWSFQFHGANSAVQRHFKSNQLILMWHIHFGQL